MNGFWFLGIVLTMNNFIEAETVTLFTEDDQLDTGVKVTRLKLTNFSAYYRGLATSGMRDAGLLKLSVPDVSKLGLQSVADFIEEDGKQTAVPTSLDRLEEVIAAASYLQVDELLLLCSQQLLLHISKCWNLVLYIASCYGLSEVRHAVCKHISKNMHQIQNNAGGMWNNFKELSVRDLCSVIDDDDCSATEKEIFDATVAWLKHEATRITTLSTEVLAVVRFPLMSADDLQTCADVLASSDISPDCYSILLEEAQTYHQNGSSVVSSRRTRLRNLVDVVIALGGFTASEQTTNRFQLIPVTELLEHSTKEIRFRSCRSERLPVRLCEHAACVLNDILYVAGGQQKYNLDGRHTTRDLYAFDLRLCVWSACSPMNIPRSLFYLGELDGQLYAVAGWMAVNEDTPTVERYTPSLDSWQRLTDFPLDVHEHAGCRHDGKLYVSGGFRGPVYGHTSQFCCYDAESDIWQQRAPLSDPRSYHSMASVQDHIIVAGGVHYQGADTFDDISSCEVYNIKSDQWTLVTRLTCPASCQPHVVIHSAIEPAHSSVSAGKDERVQVLLFGGHSFSNDTNHHWLQKVTLNSSGLWHVEDLVSLLTHGILYYTATLARLPMHYLRQFD